MIRSPYNYALRRKARASTSRRHDARLDGTVPTERAGKRGAAPVLIVKEIYIEAPIETVLEFLTDDAKIKLWLDVGMLLHLKAGRMLCRRLRGKKSEWARMEIHFSEGCDSTPARFVSESIGTLPTAVEIDLRSEGSGTRLNLTHRHRAG